MMNTQAKRYYDFNTYLRSRFGCRVQKITIDAGMTCPNRDGLLATGGCIYCNAKGSGTGAFGQGRSITDQLVHGKRALSRRYKAKKFIAYFQSFSNTYAPVEHLKSLYAEALAVDDVVGLSIGTRPDCVSPPVLDLLESHASKYLVWVEYGLQSAHDRTLRFINRGHDVARFEAAVAATRNRNIKICAHVILGLPGESRQDMLATAERLGYLALDGVKLHVLYVIKGTPLENLYRQGRYRCLEQAEYADLICDFLERLPSKMVVQRLTSDPHPDELVAPKWTLQKSANRQFIHSVLEARDTWQGRLTDAPGLTKQAT
jgi:radical SAM protein (TIGR01212 family)